ncbi:MAG: alpha/beta fold hydrolase [Microbacteriaceae bacterium]
MSISQTQYLTLPEGRLAWDSTGTGPLVVLSAGMGDLRSSWRYLVPHLTTAGYRVVTIDLRGHGDSDATFPSYGGAETATDLIALLEHLAQPAVVVGNSMSAASAVRLAADRPDLVRGIVLIGPFVRDPHPPAIMQVVMRVAMAPLWVASVWKAYLPSLYAGAVPSDLKDHVSRIARSMRRPGYSRAFSLTTRTSHDHAESSLPRVATPSLVIMGEKDPDFPDPAREAEWLGTALGSSVVMIAEAGHYPQSQQPLLVAAPLLRFLAKVAPHA